MNANSKGKNALTAQGGKPAKTRRRLFILLAVVVLFLAALLWFALSSSEPKYRGVILSRWLDRYANDFDSEPQRTEAEEAVRHIGSNSVPYLMRWLTASNSQTKEKIQEWIDKYSPIEFHITHAEERRIRAYVGFRILGPQAQSALPDLELLLLDTNGVFEAATAMCLIGPASTPALLRGLTNSNPDIRSVTASTIFEQNNEIASRRAGVDNQQIILPVSLLLTLLVDADDEIRKLALQGIQEAASRKAVEAGSAVPLLIKRLNDPNLECRIEAADALASFGPEATNAVPALAAGLQDQAETVRIAATNALKKIASETARNAGVK